MDQTPKPELLLHLKVMDSEKVVFEGEVVSLSSVNEKGDFDVLEMHANFITLIKERLVMRPKVGEEKLIEMDKGLMKVNEDQVRVFLGMEAVMKSGEVVEGEKAGEDVRDEG